MKGETPDSAPRLLGVRSWGGVTQGLGGWRFVKALLDFLGWRGWRSKSPIQKPGFMSQENVADGKAGLKSPTFGAVCRWLSPLSDYFFKNLKPRCCFCRL